MPSLMFRFLVPLLGYSTRVWVSILALIFQLRARPREQRGTDSRPLFPFVRHDDDLTGSRAMPASALARLHQTEKLLLITSPYSNYSSLGTAVSPGTGTEVRRETMVMEGGISCNSLTWGNWKHIERENRIFSV